MRVLWFALASALAATAPRASATTYASFTRLDVPGASFTRAGDIDNAGRVVGEFLASPSGSGQAFVTGDGVTYQTFEVPGAIGTVAHGINDSGQIVGFFATSDQVTHGFLKDGATYTQLDVPVAANYTAAHGINDSGQIVGDFFRGGRPHGFVLDGGTYTIFDVPGATSTVAIGINNAGQIVGIFNAGGRDQGFLKEGATYTVIAAPGALSTRPFGINDLGEIAGEFDDGAAIHGFVKKGDTYIVIDIPGGFLSNVWGINDAGQVTGELQDPSSAFHGFVATPDTVAGCDDGLDEDGDGAVDFPADPGCWSRVDASELGTTACDNGRDDDGDGRIDWRGDGSGDLQCLDLSDDSELDPLAWSRTGCGVGPELAVLLPSFWWLRRRSRTRGAEPARGR